MTHDDQKNAAAAQLERDAKAFTEDDSGEPIVAAVEAVEADTAVMVVRRRSGQVLLMINGMLVTGARDVMIEFREHETRVAFALPR